jgi:hypothetical protein
LPASIDSDSASGGPAARRGPSDAAKGARRLRPGTLSTWTWIVLGGVLLLFALFYAFNAAGAAYPWVNHDVGYHSYLGLEMYRGFDLYVDLKEDNPPGSPLLLGLVVQLGDLFGIPDFAAQHLFVLLLGLLGLLVLRSALEGSGDGLAFALVGLAYVIVVVRGNFSNNLFPGAPDIPYDFGQREHLFSLLFLPYLVFRLRGRRVPWALAPYLLLTGFVSVFKPYWPLMLAVVELFHLAERRERWWFGPSMLVTGMVLPFAGLLLLSPVSFATFFGENLPMYLRGGYTYYETSLREFVATPLHWQMVGGGLFLLGAAALSLRAPAWKPKRSALLLVLAALAYFSMVHQAKFWSYHAMTFFGLCVVAGALLLATALGAVERPLLRTAAAALAVLAALAVIGSTARSTVKMLRAYPPLHHYVTPLIEPYPRVMIFSMSVTPTYAPMLLRRDVVGPWLVFFDLPELLAIPDPVRRRRALESYAGRVEAVLEAGRPDLLVFSPNRQALPDDRSLHEIVLELGILPDAAYARVPARELRSIDRRLEVWPVYRRVPAVGGEQVPAHEDVQVPAPPE